MERARKKRRREPITSRSNYRTSEPPSLADVGDVIFPQRGWVAGEVSCALVKCRRCCCCCPNTFVRHKVFIYRGGTRLKISPHFGIQVDSPQSRPGVTSSRSTSRRRMNPPRQHARSPPRCLPRLPRSHPKHRCRRHLSDPM